MAAQEVTAAEIARLVGVSRAAVSNWRRRYLDFPDPVGGPQTSPTFSWPEVEAWLRANNRKFSPAAPAPSGQEESQPDDELVAVLLSGLMPALDTGTVVDPACGRGDTLLAAMSRSRASVEFAGQDADPAAVEDAEERFDRTYRRLLKLAVGTPFGDDKLEWFRGKADVVLCLPPIGAAHPARELPLEALTYDPRWEFGLPAASDLVGCWSQMCYSYLRPGGTAVLAFPEALTGRSAGRRIRAELVRSGALRTVVELPPGYGGRHAPLHVWTIERADGEPRRTVRMIDLSGTSPDRVPTDADGWTAVFSDASVTRDLDAIDLLDEEVALVPSLYVIPPVADAVAAFQARSSELAQRIAEFSAGQPMFRGSFNPPREFPLIEIGQLEEAKSLEIPARTAGIRSGDVVVPMQDNDPPTVVTRETDLARLSLIRNSLEILRCDTGQLDPYFVAGFLQSELNRRQLRGSQSGSQRSIRKIRIPRVPLTEQRAYGAAFQRLGEWRRQLNALAGTAESTYSLAVTALTSGALDPGEEARSRR